MVKTSHVTFSNQSDTLKCVDLLMTSSHLEPISDIDFRLVKLPTYPKSITIECSKSSGMYVNQSELCQSRVVTQLSNFYRRLPPDSLLGIANNADLAYKLRAKFCTSKNYFNT